MRKDATNPHPKGNDRIVRIGLWVAALHFGVFLVSAMLARQGGGWAGVFVWPVWFLIDFPWSLLHVLMTEVSVDSWVRDVASRSSVLPYLLYSPYLIHGIIGTIWWGFLPAFYFRYRRRRKQT